MIIVCLVLDSGDPHEHTHTMQKSTMVTNIVDRRPTVSYSFKSIIITCGIRKCLTQILLNELEFEILDGIGTGT